MTDKEFANELIKQMKAGEWAVRGQYTLERNGVEIWAANGPSALGLWRGISSSDRIKLFPISDRLKRKIWKHGVAPLKKANRQAEIEQIMNETLNGEAK